MILIALCRECHADLHAEGKIIANAINGALPTDT